MNTRQDNELLRNSRLTRIDTEWILERQGYLSRSDDSRVAIPKKLSAYLIAAIGMSMAVMIWLLPESGATGPKWIATAIGTGVAAVTLLSASYAYHQANAYQAAEEKYLSRRAAAMDDNSDAQSVL